LFALQSSANAHESAPSDGPPGILYNAIRLGFAGIGKYISSKDEIERDAVGAATFDPIEANKR
jgi:hypothetical protein